MLKFVKFNFPTIAFALQTTIPRTRGPRLSENLPKYTQTAAFSGEEEFEWSRGQRAERSQLPRLQQTLGPGDKIAAALICIQQDLKEISDNILGPCFGMTVRTITKRTQKGDAQQRAYYGVPEMEWNSGICMYRVQSGSPSMCKGPANRTRTSSLLKLSHIQCLSAARGGQRPVRYLLNVKHTYVCILLKFGRIQGVVILL